MDSTAPTSSVEGTSVIPPAEVKPADAAKVEQPAVVPTSPPSLTAMNAQTNDKEEESNGIAPVRYCDNVYSTMHLFMGPYSSIFPPTQTKSHH